MKKFILIIFLLCIQTSFTQSKKETISWLKNKFKIIKYDNGDRFDEIIDITPCLIRFRLKDKNGIPIKISFLVDSQWKINYDVNEKYIELESSKGFSLNIKNTRLASNTISFNVSEELILTKMVDKLNHLASFCKS